MDKFICIHGHFYQPPRENPWLEDVELQGSAHPYHDWNQRITAECYAPNATSRIMDADNIVIDIVNNYSKISFNFGPTLLSWMETHEPEVYSAIIQADKESIQRFSGHGSAIAQGYNHVIMPLTNRRDKYTQVRWGIKDFEKRFNRSPEGMWLPETAVDLDTLETLVEEGLKFTILSPYQAGKVREIGHDQWTEVTEGKVDPRRAYLCRLASGKTIDIFFYDKTISHEVAFAGLLRNGQIFAERLVESFSPDKDFAQLVNIATDGETYGHHHRFGDMALAYCLYRIESGKLATITNYGEFLERFPPTSEVEVIENSSWSCAHGVERWRSNCGCKTGRTGLSQEWRSPLRMAMDWLRDKLVLIFEAEASKYLEDPWNARDRYASVVLDRSIQTIEDFLIEHARHSLTESEKRSVLKLLEMQRHAMLMYTSCGWFFDEISGIETVQVLQYAARAMQLAKEVAGADLEPEYIQIIQKARSNIIGLADGSKVFEKFAKPASVDLLKVGIHHAISSLFDHPEQKAHKIYCYNINDEVYKVAQSGKLKMTVGRSKISSQTTWDEETISFAVLWLGDHNVFGGAREFMGEEAFQSMDREISSTFEKADVQSMIMLMSKHFGDNSLSLKNLFKDEQRQIIYTILQGSVLSTTDRYREIFESNYNVLRFLKEIGVNSPRALMAAAEIAISSKILEILKSKHASSTHPSLDELEKLVDDAERFSVSLDTDLLGLELGSHIDLQLAKLADDYGDPEGLESVERLIGLLRRMHIEPDLWRSQNIMFSLGRKHYSSVKERAEKGDEKASRWLTAFDKLSERLGIKIQQ